MDEPKSLKLERVGIVAMELSNLRRALSNLLVSAPGDILDCYSKLEQFVEIENGKGDE